MIHSDVNPQSSGGDVILDLRWRGAVGREHTEAFNRIALDNHASFIEFISALSRPLSGHIDWWMTNVSSRNTFSSPLFFRICSSLFLQRQLASNVRFEEIIVDSPAHLRLVKNVIGELLPNCRVSLKRNWIGLVRDSLMPVAVALKYLFLWWLVRWICRHNTPSVKDDLVLIDTFVIPGFERQDRYYPGLWEALSVDERDRIRFVPTFHGYPLHRLPRAVRSLRDSNRHWLFREEQISLKDLLFAFGHRNRVKRFEIQEQLYKGLDVTSLVKEELHSNNELGAAVLGLLNYRFFRRLKENGVSIARTIDWSENQVVDKGWNAGVKEWYPGTYSIGYQGYAVTPHYLIMYPTEMEQEAGVLPQELAVIGNQFVHSRIQYAPGVVARIAPAFRFSKIHEFHGKLKQAGRYVVLVALPKSVEEAVDILSTLQDGVLDRMATTDIEWWLKTHPAHELEALEMQIGGLSKSFKLKAQPFSELVVVSDLVISAASSVCLEAIAYNTPVIIDAGSRGLVHNPIPDDVPDDIWSLCYTPQEIVEAVGKYHNLGDAKQYIYNEIGGMVRRECFEPVTADNVRDLLGMH